MQIKDEKKRIGPRINPEKMEPPPAEDSVIISEGASIVFLTLFIYNKLSWWMGEILEKIVKKKHESNAIFFIKN